MFVLKHDPVFTTDVKIPRADGKDGNLKIKFKYKDREELRSFMEELAAEGAKRSDLEVLLDIVVGWEEVDAPFTKESLDALLKTFHGSAKAVFDAYVPALMDGQEKNSGK
ncbi:MAG: hypothetical protein HYZ18_05585 [Pseudogulbenkiania sp.]|nr:hypothetical protein [Pseudogulbenkiania sp.]